ncbi:MAG: LON peptidase substrate-binding domain-containing protein [Chloroflexi bacterium]|nr:LON peptidase substrate-binding domain-containing protein [Chloroflexota bacterium]
MPDDSTSVLAQGRRRIEIVEFTQWSPYIRVRARRIPEPGEWDRNTEALMRAVITLFEKVVSLNRNLPEDAYTFAINIEEPGWLADFVASTLTTTLETKQDILETIDPDLRLQKVSISLAKELDVLGWKTRFTCKCSKKWTKTNVNISCVNKCASSRENWVRRMSSPRKSTRCANRLPPKTCRQKLAPAPKKS